MQNIPYVKTFDKDYNLENPIDGFYSPAFPNRKTRRQKTPRFRGNNKGVAIAMQPDGRKKYFKTMQMIQQVSRERIHPVESKVICHYVS